MYYTDESRKKTADRLKELRERKGVTFEDLKAALSEQYDKNVSVATLKGLEVSYRADGSGRFDKGKGTRVDTICALSDYYGVSVAYLLGETDIQSPDVSMKAATEFTGLSEKAIEMLSHQPLNMGYTDEQFNPLTSMNGRITLRPEDLERLAEPVTIYPTAISQILEKNPVLLSMLAYYISIDDFPVPEVPSFTVDGRTYSPLKPTDLMEKAFLEIIKDEVKELRRRIVEERKGKNGK